MAAMKTPGVYIVEKSAFPNSVVEVSTAVPAFIGYTEKAINGTESLKGNPWKISSMGEYQSYFGGAPTPIFTIDIFKNANTEAKKLPVQPASKGGNVEVKKEEVTISASGKMIKVVTPQDGTFSISLGVEYTLYYNLLLFFANGGGPCYIVSVGTYEEELNSKSFTSAFDPLKKEMEPTMIVIPEAVNLPEADCFVVQQAMLKHCGLDMKNRFAMLDVFVEKYPKSETKVDYVTKFREKIGSNQLDFGAAYYPWLNTSVLSDNDILADNIVLDLAKIVNLFSKRSKLYNYIDEKLRVKKSSNVLDLDVHLALKQNWPTYLLILKAIKENVNLLPPSAAMAGLYTMVDNTRGVWKAPANISINNVIKPSVNITNEEQEDMNVPLNGKAVNAVRSFIGDGIKVWGARTLDGNSLDWRYINVRRTMIYLEESVKNAARAYVFEPNDANTWLNMKSMIDNFLRSVWKRGGLAGATPEDAYSVHVGLGQTMTSVDILEGIMRITVLVAISRPAEFIEITFQQQMQKS